MDRGSSCDTVHGVVYVKSRDRVNFPEPPVCFSGFPFFSTCEITGLELVSSKLCSNSTNDDETVLLNDVPIAIKHILCIPVSQYF